ncbi:hypothetical protein ACH5RR_001943 [Cinchona calisaya]|uniref:Uncharacterized protein n=1 Tax=Cinchona calisaya TaxID=153742 RepID=A0ABD3B4V2_9GENT
MERTEPSLIPEWLKSSGSATSISHSDDHNVSKVARSKSSVNHNDNELSRASVSDRTSSLYYRRTSSSNGSSHLPSYSSFGRNPRSRDWDNKDKDVYEPCDRDKSVIRDYRHRDYLDPPGNVFPGNFEKDGLRRSQSMISGRQGEAWPKRSMVDSDTANRSKNVDGNGLLDKGSSIGKMHKAAFERDFPSLGSEERQAAYEIGRVPSPGMSSGIHGLSISGSAMIGGDKWTSALAEIPTITGSGSTGLSSGQQASPSSYASPALSTSTSLNMAETVARATPRGQTAPKISTGTQRLEELAIRQSRQLVPMTPSMTKPLVMNSSDKAKTKSGQQQLPISSPLLSSSLHGGPVKTDASKTTNAGKLLVLKPARERNGMSPAVKDSLSPTSGSKALNSALAVATPVAGSTTSRDPANNPVSPSAERRHGLAVLEKRPTSQAQSRNDFFNLVRKKSMPNSSSVPEAVPAASASNLNEPGEVEVAPAPVTPEGRDVPLLNSLNGCPPNSSSVPEAGPVVSASNLNEPGEVEVAPAPVTPEGRDVPLLDGLNGCPPTENKINLTFNDDALHGEGRVKNGKNHSSSLPLFSEQEEAALLLKLGWQENADEGALTEEEISDFFRDLSKHMKSKPSLKISRRLQQIGAVSSGLSSSGSKLES